MTERQFDKKEEAYRVDLWDGKAGCEHCGSGAYWTVVGPGNVAIGTSWADKETAEDICDLMKMAYDAGREANDAEVQLYREQYHGARVEVADLQEKLRSTPSAIEPTAIEEGKHYYQTGPYRVPMSPRAVERFAPSSTGANDWHEAMAEVSNLRRDLEAMQNAMLEAKVLGVSQAALDRINAALDKTRAPRSAIQPIPCRGCAGRDRDLCLDKNRCAKTEAL